MKIQLIHNKDCHVWQKAKKVLKEALKETNLPGKYEIVIIKNDEEAKKYRFYGSPQITINGKDIDPSSQKATQFQTEGCRFYMWEVEGPDGTRRKKMYEYPPKEMIFQALKKGGEGK